MNSSNDLYKLAALAGGVGLLVGALAAGRGEWIGLVAGLLAGLAGTLVLYAGSRSAPAPGQTVRAFPASAESLPPPVSVPPSGPIGPAGGVGDDATGLFNEHYFTVAVDSRVAAARRHLRPVAVILVSVGRAEAPGSLADPQAVSTAIRATLRDSDTACHLDDGRFGIILEDTPEDGAILTAERLRRALATSAPDHVQRAGIACYPAHAFNTTELLGKAEQALAAARDWPQHRIEVAAAD